MFTRRVHQNYQMIRTDGRDEAFLKLVSNLDQELRVYDGEEHLFYSQYNKTDGIKHAVIALGSEKAIACGALRPYDTVSMEVKRMYVMPEFRRMGISKSILHELELWSAELGYRRCILETGKRQLEAVALYRNCQYVEIPNYGPYKGVENSICFEKWVL